MLREYDIQVLPVDGGFEIVYKYKVRHNEGDQVVAVKEYLPPELAVREGATVRAESVDCQTYLADGLRCLREEPNALIDFQSHPSTVARAKFDRARSRAHLVTGYVETLPPPEVLRERDAAG